MLRFASPPIRNAATLGGNIANGSPIGDTMPALLALDAQLVTAVAAERSACCRWTSFISATRKRRSAPGEFIARIHGFRLPRTRRARRSAYKVSKRFDQDISAVCLAQPARYRRMDA